MIFTITNNSTGRSYTTCGRESDSLELVWDSQKYWFSVGASVTITDELGRSQTFRKEC